jgi:colanic acid/amylovoran biosynthesis glycosyltransferase
LLLSLRGAHINYSPVADEGLAEQYRKVFPTIDGFHGVSQAICKEASIYGADESKCKVVYSGFDLIQFPKSNFQNDFDTLGNRPVKIISVGRSHWKKGYHFALDAMAILKQRGMPFAYTIIGAAGSEELMFQRDQLDLNAFVTFLGKVPFEGVKQHIREADVLLLPSVEEGIANVVLEATLLGTLVVTTECGGMVESVENEKTGFVVPIRNVEAIANSIQRIKESDPEFLAAIVDAAYIKTASQHNEDKMVADMLELYKSVLP